MIPGLLYLQLRTMAGRQCGFCLPLFFLGILLLPVLPLLLLALLIVSAVLRINPWRMAALVWGILASLSGFNVEVTGRKAEVLVRIV
ncbi:MAG: hypothetical protein P4K97_10145 [Terracidiphilus sp.]|nr:hypothetical protein [Terracidiphilus sp.]